MPQKEPLSPPLLMTAAVLAALPAAWLALATDALITGVAGSLAGFEWSGLSLSRSLMPHAVQETAGAHPAAAWIALLLAGPVGTALVAFLAHGLAEMTGAAAWLRVLTLEGLAFALLRLPALLVAAVVPPFHGIVGQLYERLGNPQTGRWSVGLLALLVLAAAALLLGRAGVATGRRWMRVDAPAFRRRLVRTLVGYPALVALAAWCVAEPWAAPLWMGLWLGLTVTAVTVLVS